MNHLIKFQQDHCLEDDGVLGKHTLNMMAAVFRLSKNQTAHFAGQMAHESQNFTREYENLNYSYERLLQIFSYDFDTDHNRVLTAVEKQVAMKLARRPEAIANFVYANQLGNGDENSGDGWKFRGRGPLQLSLRDNYQAFADDMNCSEIMCNPDLVVEKFYFESALWFFKKNNLWKICDQVTDYSITLLTEKINGGHNGLDKRIYLTKKFHKALFS